MPTPVWLNTLDNTPPVSQVLPLPGRQLCPNFNVQWSGTDIGWGIGSYTIYVSDNGGQFTPWLTNTTATSGTYNGQVGTHLRLLQYCYRSGGKHGATQEPSRGLTTDVIKGTFCGPIGPPTPLGGG